MNDEAKQVQAQKELAKTVRTTEYAWKHPITSAVVRLLMQEVRNIAGNVAWVLAGAPVERQRRVDSACIQQAGQWMQRRLDLPPEKLTLYVATGDNRFQQVHFRSMGWSPHTERIAGKEPTPSTHGVYRKGKSWLEFSEVRRSHPMTPTELEAKIGCKLHPRFTRELARPRPAPPLEQTSGIKIDRLRMKLEHER